MAFDDNLQFKTERLGSLCCGLKRQWNCTILQRFVCHQKAVSLRANIFCLYGNGNVIGQQIFPVKCNV